MLVLDALVLLTSTGVRIPFWVVCPSLSFPPLFTSPLYETVVKKKKNLVRKIY